MPLNPHLLHPVDIAARWKHIAEHLRNHPEDLELALENLNRWQAWGRTHPQPIEQWKKRILTAQQSPQAFESLMSFLETPNHNKEPLKSCSPFIGLNLSQSS